MGVIMKKSAETKKRSVFTYILGLLPVVFSLCTFLSFLYVNFLYFHIGESAVNIAWLVFPLLSLVCAILLLLRFFKQKDILCIVFVGVAVVVTVCSFAFANSASKTKIEHDFLKNEKCFNQTAEGLIADYERDGGTLRTYPSEELKNILPPLKAEVISTGSSKPAVFLYALETDDRFEGYAYLPDEIYPIAWDMTYTEWSDALDIESNWYYICIYK